VVTLTDQAAKKEVLISEVDTIWEELKHLHIQSAKELVERKVAEIIRLQARSSSIASEKSPASTVALSCRASSR